ncbi:MAG: hypothetical protein ABIS18_11445 [Actinomycetota bacterium]
MNRLPIERRSRPRWLPGASVIIVGSLLASRLILNTLDRAESVLWAVSGFGLGTVVGWPMRKVKKTSPSITVLLAFTGALLGTVWAKLIPAGPWDAGLAGFGIGFVYIIVTFRKETQE